MSEITGRVRKIVYKSPDARFVVAQFQIEEGQGSDEICASLPGSRITIVGNLGDTAVGQRLRVSGEYTSHPRYGRQLKVSGFELFEDPTESTLLYLASGCVKGIGAALAEKIVEAFGTDTFRIMEEEPERLSEVRGIGLIKARDIAEQFYSLREQRNAIMSLTELGIGFDMARKIYGMYGTRAPSVISENPYRLAEDIEGISFAAVDDLVRKSRLRADPFCRIRGYVIYLLSATAMEGNTCIPYPELCDRAAMELGEARGDIVDTLRELVSSGQIAQALGRDGDCLFLREMYEMELETAARLMAMNFEIEKDAGPVKAGCFFTQEENGLEFDDAQQQALVMAYCSGVSIITGGPGTGKTSILRLLLRIFDKKGIAVTLAAPTGRAAKRMSEVTGYEAFTLHRLLEVGYEGDDTSQTGRGAVFDRNEDRPLETDVVIVDEMSMADIHIFYHLLLALRPGMRLIMLGDENQLPSVGPGAVLSDLIRSDMFPVVRLKRIYRQEGDSDIIENAYRINRGEEPCLREGSDSFVFIEESDPDRIRRRIVEMVRHTLSEELELDPFDIQVMTPTRKHELGCLDLNPVIREAINPGRGAGVSYGDQSFFRGDKVMQIKNDYKAVWRIFSRKGTLLKEGNGVFNGDIGRVQEVDESRQRLRVLFDDGRCVDYEGEALGCLEGAYAITIHKSQGGEYPAVVIPLYYDFDRLMTRNLLYTAVTRAVRRVVIIGSLQNLRRMIGRVDEGSRRTQLCERISEYST